MSHCPKGASYWFSSSLGPLKTILKEELALNNSQYAVVRLGSTYDAL